MKISLVAQNSNSKSEDYNHNYSSKKMSPGHCNNNQQPKMAT